ncbi:MAG: hypothetical protein GEU76_02930 [Alphaproteobacteria bacterium]|nr:hypothetical protein [Alphaproteobacteria bacterium]
MQALLDDLVPGEQKPGQDGEGGPGAGARSPAVGGARATVVIGDNNVIVNLMVPHGEGCQIEQLVRIAAWRARP